MRKLYIIAFVLSLLLTGGVRDAYAQSSSCVNLSKAKALAAWAVATGKTYSQANRACDSGAALSGAPSGSPSSTGYCMTYDCSSFATWILRQIPGQAAVPAAGGAIPTTYVMWGSQSAGPQNGAPSGMKPCDPTKQPVCLGLTEFGEGGMSGPGHVVTALCGKVYSASPPIMDNYATPAPGTMQQSSGGVIVWVTPFGLENASMNSCSNSCSPTAMAGAGGFGGAGVNGSAANAADEEEEFDMMGMMDMMEMMGPMMDMMNGLGSSLGDSSNKNSSAASNGSTDTTGTTGTTGTSGTAAGAAAATAAAGTAGSGTTPSNTIAGGFSSLVSRLSSVLAGGSSGATVPTSGAAAAATTTASGLSATSAAQDLLNLDQQAADETPLTNSLATDPALADPTSDYHALGTADHRLSCSLTAGSTVTSCRSGSP